MLNRNLDMKIEAKTMASEARHLKQEERKAINKARKLTTHDDQRSLTRRALAYYNHETIYLERMDVRKEARLLHLSRMLLKGKEYCDVEAFTHHRVNPEELYERVWQWDNAVSPEYVRLWLGVDYG